MKTYAPKELRGEDLRGLLDDLHVSPLQVSQFLKVTERSVWRWLADGSAPFAVLAALWHETPKGREAAACDVGNELVIQRTLARSGLAALDVETRRLGRVLAISETGAANDPLMTGPASKKPQLPRLLSLGYAAAPAAVAGDRLGLEPAIFSPAWRDRK